MSLSHGKYPSPDLKSRTKILES